MSYLIFLELNNMKYLIYLFVVFIFLNGTLVLALDDCGGCLDGQECYYPASGDPYCVDESRVYSQESRNGCLPICEVNETCTEGVDGNGVCIESDFLVEGDSGYEAPSVGGGVPLQNPLGVGANPQSIIIAIIQYALGLSGVLALIAFIYGGIWWLVSLGDSNKVTKGKEIMKWAVIGLLVIFSSFAIVNMMFDLFGVK